MENKDNKFTPQELRYYIDNQWCWICGTGNWKSLPQHIFKKHGIRAFVIREMAGLYKASPISSEEHRDNCQKRLLKRIQIGEFRRAIGQSVPHELSKAGLMLNKRKAFNMIKHPNTIKAQAELHDTLKKPHACPICTKIISQSRPNCCSKECSKTLMSHHHRGANHKLSETKKRLFAEGKIKSDGHGFITTK